MGSVTLSTAERQRRYRAKRKPGYCRTCTVYKAVLDRKTGKRKSKCRRCADEALASAYISQGRPVPEKLQARIDKRKKS